MDPVPEFLFLHWLKRDPIWLLGSELAGSQDAMFDPIVNDVAADTEVFGDLLQGQFFVVPECGLGNPMAIANPFDHRGIEG